MADPTSRLKIAFVGRNRASIPTVRVDLVYAQGGEPVATFTQKIIHRADISEAQAKAESLLKQGSVDEIRQL